MAYNLDGYVTVAERLTQAHDQISIVVTEPPVLLTDQMGYIRATVALKDGRSATATASFRLDLQNKSAQATNPLEDSETSAIGRALGFLGYGSSKSVASREEVQEAERRREMPATFTQPRQQAARPPAKAEPPAPQKRPITRDGLIARFTATLEHARELGIKTPAYDAAKMSDDQMIKAGTELKSLIGLEQTAVPANA